MSPKRGGGNPTPRPFFSLQKKMFNLDEEKIECAIGNKELFLAGQESLKWRVAISDVRTRGMSLSLQFIKLD